jgi:hypothetical protein
MSQSSRRDHVTIVLKVRTNTSHQQDSTTDCLFSSNQRSFVLVSYFILNVLSLHSSQTSNGGAYRHGRSGGKSVSPSSHSLTARAAFPDAYASALDGILATERTMIGGVLRNFNLAKKLTKGGTVSGSVLSCDSDLLGALSHVVVFSLL